MKTKESNVARQYRLQQWAKLIRACNDRPQEQSIKEWCSQNDITPANYYYRLREVRKACLTTLPKDQLTQQLVPISEDLTSNAVFSKDTFLEVMVNGICVRVNDHTSPELLAMALQVAAHVK